MGCDIDTLQEHLNRRQDEQAAKALLECLASYPILPVMDQTTKLRNASHEAARNKIREQWLKKMGKSSPAVYDFLVFYQTWRDQKHKEYGYFKKWLKNPKNVDVLNNAYNETIESSFVPSLIEELIDHPSRYTSRSTHTDLLTATFELAKKRQWMHWVKSWLELEIAGDDFQINDQVVKFLAKRSGSTASEVQKYFTTDVSKLLSLDYENSGFKFIHRTKNPTLNDHPVHIVHAPRQHGLTALAVRHVYGALFFEWKMPKTPRFFPVYVPVSSHHRDFDLLMAESLAQAYAVHLAHHPMHFSSYHDAHKTAIRKLLLGCEGVAGDDNCRSQLLKILRDYGLRSSLEEDLMKCFGAENGYHGLSEMERKERFEIIKAACPPRRPTYPYHHAVYIFDWNDYNDAEDADDWEALLDLMQIVKKDYPAIHLYFYMPKELHDRIQGPCRKKGYRIEGWTRLEWSKKELETIWGEYVKHLQPVGLKDLFHKDFIGEEEKSDDKDLLKQQFFDDPSLIQKPQDIVWLLRCLFEQLAQNITTDRRGRWYDAGITQEQLDDITNRMRKPV